MCCKPIYDMLPAKKCFFFKAAVFYELVNYILRCIYIWDENTSSTLCFTDYSNYAFLKFGTPVGLTKTYLAIIASMFYRINLSAIISEENFVEPTCNPTRYTVCID